MILKVCTSVPRGTPHPRKPWVKVRAVLEAHRGDPAGLPTATFSSTACELGFYKSAPGDQLCARCPPHSHSAAPAAQTCRCDLSYYRAALDPPSAACTREYQLWTPEPSRLRLDQDLVLSPTSCREPVLCRQGRERWLSWVRSSLRWEVTNPSVVALTSQLLVIGHLPSFPPLVSPLCFRGQARAGLLPFSALGGSGHLKLEVCP